MNTVSQLPSDPSSPETKAARAVSPYNAVSAVIAAKKKVDIGGIDRTSVTMSMDVIYRAQGAVRADLITNLQKQLRTIKGYEDISVQDSVAEDVGD